MLKDLQHPNIVRFYDYWERTDPSGKRKCVTAVLTRNIRWPRISSFQVYRAGNGVDDVWNIENVLETF